MTTITQKVLPEQTPPWCPIHGEIDRDTCCPECDQELLSMINQHCDPFEEVLGG
jgi:hypothetical protein